MRVLLTGAAGSIGTVVARGLVDRGHQVAGLDMVPEPEGFTGEWATADCSDPDAVEAVFTALSRSGGVDAVVHLAGIPEEASLPEELTSHVVTTAALLDAMVRHGVTRIAFASSNHAVGLTPRAGLPDGLLRTDVRPRPDTFYGVAKVAAEGLLSLYVDRHGLDAVAMRIGSFLPQPESARALATWLSHDDAVRMVEAALTAPDPGFAVLYGVSANTRGWWDLDPGRALGYHPVDDAERFADEVLTGGDPDGRDRDEAAVVGGPMALPDAARPALDGPTPVAVVAPGAAAAGTAGTHGAGGAEGTVSGLDPVAPTDPADPLDPPLDPPTDLPTDPPTDLPTDPPTDLPTDPTPAADAERPA